jgi:hypothetical protein
MPNFSGSQRAHQEFEELLRFAKNLSGVRRTSQVREELVRSRKNQNLNPETSGSTEKSTVVPRIGKFNSSGDTSVRKRKSLAAKRNFSRNLNWQFKFMS